MGDEQTIAGNYGLGSTSGARQLLCDQIGRGLLCLYAHKVWSTFGDVKLLTVPDPITGLSFKYMMLLAAGAELAIAAVCLFTKF